MDASDEPWDGRRYLTQVQYADDSNLKARQSIYAYQDPKIELWSWALGLAGLVGSESILDVGCGNGNYLVALSRRGHTGPVLGLDLSVGMLAAARGRCPAACLTNADAGSLPFADRTVDAVLAMHMLYHCPDRAAAIAELRRVTRPAGVAIVMTNGSSHLGEMDELMADAVDDVTGTRPDRIGRNMNRFPAEKAGAELETSFGRVEAHWATSALHVPTADPVVDYARSMSAFLTVSDVATVEAVLDAVRRRAAEVVSSEGELLVTTSVTCFVCRA